MLLAVCCGVCAVSAVCEFRNEYDITFDFFGSNLCSGLEYNKRVEAVRVVNEKLNDGREMFVLPYNKSAFLHYVNSVVDYAKEPEGGKRCVRCFEMRLIAAATRAVGDGYDCFATSLVASPHKDVARINQIGQRVARDLHVPYVSADLRLRSAEASEMVKGLGIYRQNFCGCEFSEKPCR
jgi:hypothetical protein